MMMMMMMLLLLLLLLLMLLLLGASRQGLALPTIYRCYRGKDTVRRTRLCSIIGRDELYLIVWA
jgi:hypothetical protein